MSDIRRWVPFLGLVGAAALLGAAAVTGCAYATPDVVAQPRPDAGVLPQHQAGQPGTWPGRVGVATGPIALRYTFDAGIAQPITSVTGGHPLHALSQNGGTLSLVRQGAGMALAYPPRCRAPHERKCPRAILEGDRDDNLNPGRRPLTYGASVLMTHSDLADGANVFQKGYSVGGVSQFKLQVDHRLGHPSCVIAGQSARIYRAEPLLDVADGTWHNLVCARTATSLTIIVDGVPRATVPVPAKVSIANTEPIRVGGKGPNKGNDQFAGMIDNVFMTIA
jgi:Concanavalin A-like lectin/glucanases superfamily